MRIPREAWRGVHFRAVVGGQPPRRPVRSATSLRRSRGPVEPVLPATRRRSKRRISIDASSLLSAQCAFSQRGLHGRGKSGIGSRRPVASVSNPDSSHIRFAAAVTILIRNPLGLRVLFAGLCTHGSMRFRYSINAVHGQLPYGTAGTPEPLDLGKRLTGVNYFSRLGHHSWIAHEAADAGTASHCIADLRPFGMVTGCTC